MRGLLLRLSDLDPDASSALRVIQYFDQLVKNGASLEALTRASAALGSCAAGLRDEESGRMVRFDGNGLASPPLLHPVVIEAPVLVDDIIVGHVWLERDARQPLDEMLVERMAMTAAARWRPMSGPVGADPALVELVLGAGAEDEDRVRALRLLGMFPNRPIRAVAVSAPSGDIGSAVQAIVAAVASGGGMARAAQLGMSGAVLVQTQADLNDALSALPRSICSGLRIGLGCSVPTWLVAQSWVTARTAARFASAWRHKGNVVDYDKLGALAALAMVPREAALANPDVQALAELARTESGDQDIEVLLAVTWHGSARQAATELHLHHSSITNRLRHVEAALGVSVEDPSGRLRAQIAAILWRLHM
jgi:hypothetical protein